MLDTHFRKHIEPIEKTLVLGISKTNLKPNHLTYLAFLAGILSAIWVGQGGILGPIVVLWISGSLDVLDGSLARFIGQTSPFGAYLDMILDRIVEIAIILGLYYLNPEVGWACLIFLSGVIFNFTSFMLAGNLFNNKSQKSMHYDIGLVERTETFITFSFAIYFSTMTFWILMVFNGLMFLTGIIRIYRIYKHLERTTS